MKRRSGPAALLGALLAACGPPVRPAIPFRVEQTAVGSVTRLTLIASPGFKVNARLPPALELPDGHVVHFAGAELTVDSAYYAIPPTAIIAGAGAPVRGTLRASVCAVDERYCRSVVIRL